jgi:regulator of protease activity HflC (stomatin/prohibitin superfamily)
MTAFLDKLFELVRAWFTYLVPFEIIQEDMCGIVLRLGRFHRYTRAGLNWKIPLIEHILVECAALDTTILREQSLTTRDGVSVTVRGELVYKINDARKYILDCGNGASVVNDLGCVCIAQLVCEREAESVLQDADGTFAGLLERRVRARAKRWGLHVDSFVLIDCVKTRTYRIITNSTHGDGLPPQ